MNTSWYIAGTVTMTTSAPATAAAGSSVTPASPAKPVLPAVVSESAVTSMPPAARAAASLAGERRQLEERHLESLERVVGGDREPGGAGAAHRQAGLVVHASSSLPTPSTSRQ